MEHAIKAHIREHADEDPTYYENLSQRVDELLETLSDKWDQLAAKPGATEPKINIHWATLQLPPSLIDYVIVHELAHLAHANHTPEFWSLVERSLPNYQTLKDNTRHPRAAYLARRVMRRGLPLYAMYTGIPKR